MDTTMKELHQRITAAIERSVSNGIEEKTAFKNHMKELAEKNPAVYKAYAQWLLTK